MLKKLKELLQTDYFVKIGVLHILDSLSNHIIASQDHSAIIKSISELLNVLLKDTNVIIKQNALEVVNQFIIKSSHGEIAEKCIDSMELQTMLMQLLEKKIVVAHEEVFNYLKFQKENKFEHRCIEWPNNVLPKCKKTKLEMKDILENIKNNIDILTSNKSKLTQDNHSDIVMILNKLHNLI